MSDEPQKQDDVIARSDEEATKQSHDSKTGETKHGLFHHGCKNCDKHKKESEEHLNNWRRALADYDNLKKETEARRAEWAKYSEQQILEEFIPVYDNMKKALAVSLPLPEGEQAEGQRGWESWKEGVGHIMKQFADVLKQHGVEEIKTVGEKFDPNLHEAVGHEESEDKDEGEIIREVAGGYKMGERVIRAAKVIVVK